MFTVLASSVLWSPWTLRSHFDHSSAIWQAVLISQEPSSLLKEGCFCRCHHGLQTGPFQTHRWGGETRVGSHSEGLQPEEERGGETGVGQLPDNLPIHELTGSQRLVTEGFQQLCICCVLPQQCVCQCVCSDDVFSVCVCVQVYALSSALRNVSVRACCCESAHHGDHGRVTRPLPAPRQNKMLWALFSPRHKDASVWALSHPYHPLHVSRRTPPR